MSSDAMREPVTDLTDRTGTARPLSSPWLCLESSAAGEIVPALESRWPSGEARVYAWRVMPGRRSLRVLAAVAVIATSATDTSRAADEPSLDTVMKRVAAYVAGYGPQLANIVAEERYLQWIETEPGTVVVPSLGRTRRE